MQQFEKVVYTAKTRTTGGRENGLSRSLDGHLDVKLAAPDSARIGTNPEQLLATAWSACFESAIVLAAGNRKIVLPAVPVIEEASGEVVDTLRAPSRRSSVGTIRL